MDGSGANGRRARLVALVERQPVDEGVSGLGALLQQLCRATSADLQATGAAVHLVTSSGVSGVLAASGPRARAWADLAFVAGEGPCGAAAETRRIVRVPDLRHHDRWPGYSGSAGDTGLAAVHAFPLSLGVTAVGVLDVYDDRARVLSEDEVTSGVALAQLGTEMMVAGSRSPQAGLSQALDLRAEVAQAQGMVMVDLGISLVDALVRLRAHSFASGEPLADLARRVIGGFVLPDGNGAGPTVDLGREKP